MSDLLFKKLDELSIHYLTYNHEPLFTIEQAMAVASTIPGAQCKNLFLKDSKDNLYLVVAIHDTIINLKKLSKYLNAPELRFAKADLLKAYLGVEPGSVTPFGLINDISHKVFVILDAKLFEHQLIGFHPLINNATIVISFVDLKKFVVSCKNKNIAINFDEII